VLIRPATKDDAAVILSLARAMHAESRYRSLPFSTERTGALVAALIEGRGAIFLYEREGQVIGMMAGAVGPLYFAEVDFAYDVALFVLPEYRGTLAGWRLVKRFMAWAKEQGVAMVDIGISTCVNTERTGALYERVGLAHVGALYSTLE
jgi:GNAT superfamily N-acetyltransferase